MPQPRALGLALSLCFVILVQAAAPVTAHNPANTVYEPAPLGEDLLVLGEEGTAALLTLEGQERWNQTLDTHIVEPPKASGSTAATVTRSLKEAIPHVQAFDADGPSWKIQLDKAGAFGFITPTQAGFLALSTHGQLLNLTHDGEIRTQTRLEISPTTAPIPGVGQGWIVAGGDEGTVSHVREDGSIQAETQTGGRVRDLARLGSMVLVATEQDRRPVVKALDASLETRWIDRRDGFRIGGEIATGEDRVYLGTFNPNGAIVAALAGDGSPAWNRSVPNATAAGVATDTVRVYAAGNDAIYAYGIDGDALWSAPAQPRIASPSLVGSLVLPAGADNRLVALDASDGSVAWTWSDNVSRVPWTDEQISAPSDDEDEANGASWLPVVGALALLAVVAVLRRR